MPQQKRLAAALLALIVLLHPGKPTDGVVLDLRKLHRMRVGIRSAQHSHASGLAINTTGSDQETDVWMHGCPVAL